MIKPAKTFLGWFIAALLCSFASAQEPDPADLAYVLSRTVHIGNCSGVILPPVKDPTGRWHWFVATAAHCATGSNRTVQLLYPADKSRKFTGREVVRFGGGGTVDMLIIEVVFPESAEPLPFAELAGVEEAKPDDAVVVTGYPARGNQINPVHRGLVWKPAKIKSIRDMVTIDESISSGNSGGPVWHGHKALGIASTTSLTGPVSSHFTGPASLHKAYHQATEKAGATVTCADNCWDKIFKRPGREPGREGYKPPPSDDVIRLNARIAELDAKIAILLGQQPAPAPTQPIIVNPSPSTSPPGPAPAPLPNGGPTRDQLMVLINQVLDSRKDLHGQDGRDGLPGEPGRDGKDGKDGRISQAQIEEIIEQVEGDLLDQAKRTIDELRNRIADLENRKAPTYAISCVGADGVERKLIQFVEKTPGNFVATIPPLEAVMLDLTGAETRTWFTFGVPITIKNRHFSEAELKVIGQEAAKAR